MSNAGKMKDLFPFLFFALLLLPLPAFSEAPALNDDVLGLTVFKADLHDPLNRLASWNEDAADPCAFSGVTCDRRSSRATDLSLPGFSLSGRIGRGLLRLNALRSLSLAGNNLSGPLIPDHARLDALRFIDLSSNRLSGAIPADFFSQCRSLRSLSLCDPTTGFPEINGGFRFRRPRPPTPFLSPSPMANPLYGPGPLRSREGLFGQPAASSDEIQLRIDPIHADVDDEITGLHSKITQLKGMNMIKVSNIMGIESKPFDLPTFMEEDVFLTDESGANKRIRLEDNIVCYRRVNNRDRTTSVRELHRWKLEEARKFEELRQAEEAALKIAAMEKTKCKAAIEAAEAAQKIVELEAQKRLNAEIKAKREAEEKKKTLGSMSHSDLRYMKYTIEEIEVATNYFSEAQNIGEGGYGPVYRASLDHTLVVIKVLRPDAAQGRKQF